jgi:hypothetical protein
MSYKFTLNSPIYSLKLRIKNNLQYVDVRSTFTSYQTQH